MESGLLVLGFWCINLIKSLYAFFWTFGLIYSALPVYCILEQLVVEVRPAIPQPAPVMLSKQCIVLAVSGSVVQR